MLLYLYKYNTITLPESGYDIPLQTGRQGRYQRKAVEKEHGRITSHESEIQGLFWIPAHLRDDGHS